jgi:hypothetical protein
VETDGDVSHPALAVLTPSEFDAAMEAFLVWKSTPWASVPWRHEVGLVYDAATDTARELPKGEHRAYGELLPSEIPMTLDLLHVDGSAGYVADLKGSSFGGHAHVSEHAQLATNALAVARAFMLDEVHVYLLNMDAGTITPHEHVYDAAGLDGIAAQQVARLARIPDSTPQPGAHCADLYCPALTVCPATQRTVALAVSAPDPTWATTAPTTPEHALWLRDGADVLEEMAKEWKARARAYADANNGVPLPDGRVWRRTDVERETIVLDGPGGAEAEDALRRAGVAIEVKRTATKGAIEKAIAARGLKGKELKAAIEEVLVPLRVAGATRTTTIPTYRESKS